MPKVYGYLRVSTVEQVNGLAAQKDCIERTWGYLFRDKTDDQQQPYTWAGEYTDQGVSGGTPFRQRPEGSKLALTLEPGDVVIVSKLDRAFRNVRDAAETLEWFTERGLWLVVVDMGIDSRSPIGRMLVAILAAVAAFERERIKERLREARAAAKAKGKSYGEKPTYGFRRGKMRAGKKRIVPDPYTRHCARLFLKWHHEEGLTKERIYIRCLEERIRERSRGWDNKPGREAGIMWIRLLLAREPLLQEYERIHGPTCSEEAIAAIKVGKFNR